LDWKKSGVPQRLQKLRTAGADDAYRASRSSPATSANVPSGKPAQVTNPAPCARRHIEQ